jgi:hypothetical protein
MQTLRNRSPDAVTPGTLLKLVCSASTELKGATEGARSYMKRTCIGGWRGRSRVSDAAVDVPYTTTQLGIPILFSLQPFGHGHGLHRTCPQLFCWCRRGAAPLAGSWLPLCPPRSSFLPSSLLSRQHHDTQKHPPLCICGYRMWYPMLPLNFETGSDSTTRTRCHSAAPSTRGLIAGRLSHGCGAPNDTNRRRLFLYTVATVGDSSLFCRHIETSSVRTQHRGPPGTQTTLLSADYVTPTRLPASREEA